MSNKTYPPRCFIFLLAVTSQIIILSSCNSDKAPSTNNNPYILLDTTLQNGNFVRIQEDSSRLVCKWGGKDWSQTQNIIEILSQDVEVVRDLFYVKWISTKSIAIGYSYGTNVYDTFLVPRHSKDSVRCFYKSIFISEKHEVYLRHDENEDSKIYLFGYNRKLLQSITLSPIKDSLQLVHFGLEDVNIRGDTLNIKWPVNKKVIGGTFIILN